MQIDASMLIPIIQSDSVQAKDTSELGLLKANAILTLAFSWSSELIRTTSTKMKTRWNVMRINSESSSFFALDPTPELQLVARIEDDERGLMKFLWQLCCRWGSWLLFSSSSREPCWSIHRNELGPRLEYISNIYYLIWLLLDGLVLKFFNDSDQKRLMILI